MARRMTARSRPVTFIGLAAALVTVLLAGLLAPAHATARGGDGHGHGHGRYTTTGARFWTWVLSQPATTNPLTDTDGRFCARGQQGKTWILAGALDETPVTRTCVVPRGKKIVVPVRNSAYFAFLSDPEEQRTEAFVRSQVASLKGTVRYRVTVDEVPLRRSSVRYEESVLFSVTLPADNLYGLPAGFVLEPSVDAGYYAHLQPLRPGRHTIRIHAWDPDGAVLQDVTWRVIVPRRNHHH